MTARRQPFRHPAAWRPADLGGKRGLTIELDQRHRDALLRALEVARARNPSHDTMTAADFPLAGIADDVATWRHELRDGRGLLVLAGFPVEEMSLEDTALAYLGFGLHFGRAVSQSNLGERVGDVVNIGGMDQRERAYRNARELSLHTDRCDHVAMLCLRPAWRGGISGYASALTVHDVLLAERPELLEPLYAGFRHHRFGEQLPGEPPVTTAPIPIFSITDGVPGVVWIRYYIDLAEREGHVRLSDLEHQALDAFDAVANRPDVRIDFPLERGELALFNNCLLLHTRTAFEDDPARPDLRRHLMRLWLMEDGRPAAPGVRLHKGDGGIAKVEGRGTWYAGAHQDVADDARRGY